MADDLESLGSWALPSLFKFLPLVDLDLFYSKVKFGHLGFCMGKGKTADLCEAIGSYDIQI